MNVREAAQPQIRGSELQDGSLLIVSREEPAGWLQSDVWVRNSQ